MPTRKVSLTTHFDQFIEGQVQAGQFKSVDEVVNAGLRLLEQQVEMDRKKLELMRELIAEGARSLDQGRGLPFESEEQLGELLRRPAKQASTSKARQRTRA